MPSNNPYSASPIVAEVVDPPTYKPPKTFSWFAFLLIVMLGHFFLSRWAMSTLVNNPYFVAMIMTIRFSALMIVALVVSKLVKKI